MDGTEKVLLLLAGTSLATLGGLQLLKRRDASEERDACRRLSVPADEKPFDQGMVSALPDPARRYFLFSIAQGTPLGRRAEIEMAGRLGLGSLKKPNYIPFKARQILSAPHGFLWKVRAGSGVMRFSGSDGYLDGRGWTRFWLWNAVPIVRAGGTTDYGRSAAARGIAEALFWTPAALLLSGDVRWEPLDSNSARVVIRHRGEDHAVDLTVAPDGRPLSMVLQRWSRENPERQWRHQPFGGTIEEMGTFGGYTVATRVEGGNHFGTPSYFPFYQSQVREIRFF
jgi:hypothetical protein